MFSICDIDGGVTFKIRVQPRAAKNQLAGMYEDAVKVRITSPPVDGEANIACIEFFAKQLGVPKSNISILIGETGRNKTLKVKGISSDEVKRKLNLI